jgi:hypothetical protein
MRRLILCFIFILPLIDMKICYALSVETHEAINESIASNKLNGFSMSEYLNNNLGFTKGKDEPITKQTIQTTAGSITGTTTVAETKEVYKWLIEGGRYEDKPPETFPYLRSINHFHNPLKSLDRRAIPLFGVNLL